MTEPGKALRRLGRRPGRGLALGLTLAIGVTAMTLAFAVVDTVLLRGLPVADAEELVVVWQLNPDRGAIRIPFRPATYDAVARGVASLEEVAGVSAWGAAPVPIGSGRDAYAMNRVHVVGDFFGVLGTEAILGRLPDHTDDRVGATPVAALSHTAWVGRFGSDPSIVGSTLEVDGTRVTVVGVAPLGFDFPHGTDLWTPLRHDFAGAPGFVELHLVGRMAAGVDPRTVVEEAARATSVVAGDGTDLEPVVRRLDEVVRGPVRPLAQAGFAAAVLLLFAASANGTLLFLAGGRTTMEELAIRQALGAERMHLFNRLAADAVLVASLGALTGLAGAWLALGALAPLIPPELPYLGLVTLDARSLLFGLSICLAALATTLAAATIVAWRRDPSSLLRGRGGVRPSSWARIRRGVAGMQVALTVVSTTVAGLMVRSVRAMDRLDPGMPVDEMVTVSLRVPYTWFQVPESYFPALEALVEELESRPGIVSVSPTLGPPLQQRLEVVFAAEEQTVDAREDNPYVSVDAVLPGHFERTGIPLRAGRDLTSLDDRRDADPVVVVDEVLAAALWPGESPLGKRLGGFPSEGASYTVVGVAAPTRYREYLEPHPRAYFPLRALSVAPPSAVLIRVDGTAAATVGELVRDAFARLAPEIQVLSVASLTEALRVPTLSRRFAAGILSAFALATVLLAAVGVYGVFSLGVQERNEEMGVRRALGARRREIVALVLVATLRVALLGVAAGLVAAFWVGSVVESLLFGVTPVDGLTLAMVAGGSVTLALLAALVPALRAAATQPVVSLRTE